MQLRKLIKHKMLDLNREDFVAFLSELLGCSRGTASNKLNGITKFTEQDISILIDKLGFTADELMLCIGE